MIFITVFYTALPVFLLMAAGYIFGFIKKIDLEAPSDLVMYLTSPCLAFTAIYQGYFKLGDLTALWGAFFWVAGILGVGLWLLSRSKYGTRFSWYFLPVIFMNSGNLGFPLSQVFFGSVGLTLAVLFNTINAILIYSLGVALVKKDGNFWQFLKVPYIYAVLLAVLLRYTGLKIPGVLYQQLLIIGNLTVPLMLLSLGHRMHDFKIKYLASSLVPTALRIGGGFVLALAFVYLFKISGPARNIILLLSALPSAISSYTLAEKYNYHTDEVATAVTVSNFLGILFVPLVIWVIRYL